MIFGCLNCDNNFDSENKPETCPFCGENKGFSTIQIFDKNGNEITWAEELAGMRDYVKKHSYLTPEEVDQMSERDLANLYDVMMEC